MAIIGKRNILAVLRDSSSGVYLDGGEHGEILLPNRYVPRGVTKGDRLDVFVYLDSDDRLVATTETPLATVGEVATLRVVSINRQIGAFLDWGLAKDLLLPFREQMGSVRVGQDVDVLVYLDKKTERIAASMKVGRQKQSMPTHYRIGQQVECLISDKTPLGYKVLVDGEHSGLLYHDGLSVPVAIGQKRQGFVRAIRPDGKLDLSLDPVGYRRVAPLALRIVQALQESGGRLRLDDNSSPADIRQEFSASKKAFKQALGTLYKARRIRFNKPGIELLDNTTWSPSTPLIKTGANSKRSRGESGTGVSAPARENRR